MRMLGWMNGNTRRDMIRNDTMRERERERAGGLTLIVKKLVENRLRCFGQIERVNPKMS